MRAALIPPKGYEATALKSDIHLVLPLPPLVDSEEYLDTYKEARRQGHYIILDNGCAEGQLVDGGVLMAFARLIGAHEIVAPDIMNDAGATQKATEAWLAEHEEAHDYNIMGVVQGTYMKQRMELIKYYADQPCISTLGVPKACITGPDSTERLELVEAILNQYGDRFKIHLLGLSKHFCTEMLTICYPKEVRSMDSAQPYKVTELGRMLVPKHARAARRQGYFSRTKYVMDSLLEHNIDVFKSWAASNEG